METHELDIEISPQGEVRMHVKGVKGPGCIDYVKLLESIMGAEGEIERTSEFYQAPTGVAVHLEEQEQRTDS